MTPERREYWKKVIKLERRAAREWYSGAVWNRLIPASRDIDRRDEKGSVAPYVVACAVPKCGHPRVDWRKGDRWVFRACPDCGRGLSGLEARFDAEALEELKPQPAEDGVTRNREPKAFADYWRALQKKHLPIVHRAAVPYRPFVWRYGRGAKKVVWKRDAPKYGHPSLAMASWAEILRHCPPDIGPAPVMPYILMSWSDGGIHRDLIAFLLQAKVTHVPTGEVTRTVTRWVAEWATKHGAHRSWWNRAARIGPEQVMEDDDLGDAEEAATISVGMSNYTMWVPGESRKPLAGLDDMMRQLREVEGLTVREIARRLGVHESRLRLLIRKASTKTRNTSSSRRISSYSSISDIAFSFESRPAPKLVYPDNQFWPQDGSRPSIQHTETTSGGHVK